MPDFMGLMKQAAEIKSKMEALQNELDHIEVEGSAGGDLVAVKLSAQGELKPAEKQILEDLIIAAHADARRKAETLLQEKMKALTGGLPLQLPPGLKLF